MLKIEVGTISGPTILSPHDLPPQLRHGVLEAQREPEANNEDGGRLVVWASPLSSPVGAVKRTCKKCSEEWVADPVEADFFRGKGTSVPRICTSCRAESRKFQDAVLACSKCETEFAWPKEMALYATMFDWKEPHRCPGGCDGDRSEIRRFRGDMYAVAPVWLRKVEDIDLDAEPPPDLTPEQRLREVKVPKLDELFKGLGSGMSGGPSFGDLPRRSSLDDAVLTPKEEDDLPPENLPSPESLFSNLKKS
ncbi:MAG: hypothetical protein KDA24_19955 [Deltaproteobacteria bacterium]|nr:hypothetical protein [Deltaproteobacteria bacterium]